MFESLKEKIYRKERKNSKEIIIDDEVILIKKSRLWLIGDWRRIYPSVNEDRTWNIPNIIFGGWKNLVSLVLIGILIAMIFFGFYEVFNQLEFIKENVCQICQNQTAQAVNMYKPSL